MAASARFAIERHAQRIVILPKVGILDELSTIAAGSKAPARIPNRNTEKRHERRLATRTGAYQAFSALARSTSLQIHSWWGPANATGCALGHRLRNLRTCFQLPEQLFHVSRKSRVTFIYWRNH
jgi:hypothetical protein